MEKTVALFDLPYQWVFPVIFISMTVLIGVFFVKYVIFDDGKDDDEDKKQDIVELSEQAEEEVTPEARESFAEKEQK